LRTCACSSQTSEPAGRRDSGRGRNSLRRLGLGLLAQCFDSLEFGTDIPDALLTSEGVGGGGCLCGEHGVRQRAVVLLGDLGAVVPPRRALDEPETVFELFADLEDDAIDLAAYERLASAWRRLSRASLSSR
jgi:hypothetical protein